MLQKLLVVKLESIEACVKIDQDLVDPKTIDKKTQNELIYETVKKRDLNQIEKLNFDEL